VGTGATALALSGTSFAAANPPPLSQAPVMPQAGFAPLVARVKPAVVQIATVSRPQLSADEQGDDQDNQGSQTMPQMPDMPGPFGDFFRHYFQQHPGQGRLEQRALGSGFIIDPQGIIVTNNHVVDGAREVSVTLTDGSKYKAKVLGRDAKTDLALVKIDAGHPLPYVTFGDSDNEHEGDWVIAVGNPYGLNSTVTAGIVSAHGRNINAGPYDDFLQIDAPINPGNSGGPLFNQSGQVVGIDTAIYSPSGGSVGIGFAIPAAIIHDVVAQLETHGHVSRGWLGVQIQPVTPEIASAVGLKDAKGALVAEVVPNGPAAKAGIEQGDIIVAINGQGVDDSRDLSRKVALVASGQSAAFTVVRNGQSRTVKADIGLRPDDKVASAAPNPPAGPAATGNAMGLGLAALTPEARKAFNVPEGSAGVIITKVDPNSDAADKGLQPGDVVQKVGTRVVHTPADVQSGVAEAQKGGRKSVLLLVASVQGGARFVAVDIGAT
jgi:serine protease Do